MAIISRPRTTASIMRSSLLREEVIPVTPAVTGSRDKIWDILDGAQKRGENRVTLTYTDKDHKEKEIVFRLFTAVSTVLSADGKYYRYAEGGIDGTFPYSESKVKKSVWKIRGRMTLEHSRWYGFRYANGFVSEGSSEYLSTVYHQPERS